MKKMEILIRHSRLEAVKKAILEIGLRGMTVSEVKGFGRQGGHKESYRGKEILVEFLPKLKIELALEEDLLESAIRVICEAASTGAVGDGKIFISPLDDVVRIRTGERGDKAL